MLNNEYREESNSERWATITARGDDAEVYLQGQLSQDVGALDADTCWSLVLSPDSSVLSAVEVAVIDDGYALSVPAVVADDVLAALRRFLLRTKCVVELAHAERAPFTSLAQRLDERWPGGGEYRARLTPHSYGQHFVERTISFTKGCFTGQELVGRLDARGASVPWRVVYFEANELERVEALLRDAGPSGPQGVTSILYDGASVRGMGIAHRTLLQREDHGGVHLEALA